MQTSATQTRRSALQWLGAAALSACALTAPQALAQSAWPSKPITIIVPFPVGGGTDTFARPLSNQLTKALNQKVIIDNRGGAGGNLGAGLAAKATPDGYTWFMGGVHHTIAPSVYPKLDYSLQDDFIPIALVSSVPQVIVVNPQKVPATDLKGFIAYLKANPGRLTYGSAGNGSSHHLAGELFKLQTKTFVTHIPYRGAGPALQDLLGGQVDMMFDGLGSSAAHLRGGRLKAIAVAGERRAPGFADVPSTVEAGLPSYQVATWYGLWAPKGTPKEALDKMAEALKLSLSSKEIQAMWATLGAEPATLAGKPFADFVQAETRRWAEVVRTGGIKME